MLEVVGSFFNRNPVTPTFTSKLRVYDSLKFQVLFTALPGYFSPFPHGTSSLSVFKNI